jgi:hypothetical protein
MGDRRRNVNERRKSARVPAVFAVKKALGRQVQLCQAEDIAPSGITIKRPRGNIVAPRTEVELEFSLPGSQDEIATRGLVVNDVLAGSFRRTGVRFIALRPEHAQLIAGYCRRLSSTPARAASRSGGVAAQGGGDGPGRH